MAYGWKAAKALVDRELDQQARLSGRHEGQALHVPALLGPPGIGKTELFEQAAIERDMTMSVFNGGEIADPTDLAGIALPSSFTEGDSRGYVLEYYLPEPILLATRQPTLLLIDDFDKAPARLQGIFLALCAGRTVRDRALHPNSLVCFAGNRIEDDNLSNDISASLRSRTTAIPIEARLRDFTEYGTSTESIHPAVLGFLQYRPEYLYKPATESYRFPTPRTWKEASQDLFEYSDPDAVIARGVEPNWKTIVSLKCGAPVGHDFWAWFKIVKDVDVNGILREGRMPDGTDKDGHIVLYAAVFAVVATLINSVRPSYTHLPDFCKTLSPELRVAMLMQLPQKTINALRKQFPKVIDLLMGVLV